MPFSEFESIDSGDPQKRPKQLRVSRQIRSCLESAGISAHNQATHVAKLLSISYPSARRLLTGFGIWNDEDIDLVLKSVGLRCDGLVIEADSSQSASSKETDPVHTCTLNVDGVEIECLVHEVFPPTPPPPASDTLCLLVQSGVDQETKSVIIRSSAHHNRADMRVIRKIEIVPSYGQTGPRVALLDDSEQEVEALTKGLIKSGFRVEPFTSADDLVASVSSGAQYDIFLMDWTLQGRTEISDYLEDLRRFAPDAVMTIMTGQFRPENDEKFMATTESYNLTMLSKPTPLLVIVSHLLSQHRLAKGLLIK